MNEQQTAVNEIMELERETYRRFKAGDIDWVMEQTTDDLLLFNPGSEILNGKDHERKALLAANQMDGMEITWEPTSAHISALKDMAYAYGTIKVRTQDGEELSEKYVTIWRKEDSFWKLALQMRNSNN